MISIVVNIHTSFLSIKIMRITLSILLLMLLSTIMTFGQNTVPPVKRESSGTMKIAPDPNKNNQRSSATSTNSSSSNSTTQQSTTASDQNSISLIIDHSGSMNGLPLQAAKNSSIILIDLIELWGQRLFPQKIGNISFQYIQFGGTGEHNVLFNLSKISNANQLRSDIINSTTNYGGTDFSSGIDPALDQLKGKNFNNKTIFLTDGGDVGSGPNQNGGFYDDLIDTKFIIYNSPNTTVQQQGWLGTVPNGSEYHVDSEYEVLSIFVKTLFEFVDDIDYYLVRQGKQNINKGIPFKIIKHTPDKENMLILSKPANTNLEIEKIVSPTGNDLSQNDYSIYSAQTFYNIFLNDSLPNGEYQIVFKNSSISQSHDIFYIDFERCNIFLNLLTSPDLKAQECFLENSSVNFEFKYWDSDLDKEIDYPDFISHSAYHFQIVNNIVDNTGKGKNGLVFSYSFPFGSAGSYQAWTAWSYNEEKMRMKNSPPLSLLTEFCITKNGSLVHLEYDSTQTWEGRQLQFTATVLDSNQFVINNTKELYLKTGQNTVVLVQDSSDKGKYTGVLDYVAGDTQYSLSLENRDNRFLFAIDKSSETVFTGKKRYIKVSYHGKDFTSYSTKNINNIFKKIEYVFSSKDVPTKTYSFVGNNLTIPYYLPYYDQLDDNIEFFFSINKIFPDESVNLLFNTDSSEYEYSAKEVASGGLWGMFSRKHDYPDAVTVKLNFADSADIRPDGQLTQEFLITKKQGEMFFTEPLYKEPAFEVIGDISFQIDNSQRVINLDHTDVSIEITTSGLDKFYILTKWGLYKFLLLFFICLFLFVYTVLFLVSRYKCNQKVRLWRRLDNNDLSLLQDLWSEPVNHKKCNSKLELPEEIKVAFKNEKGIPDKKVFLQWTHSENSKTIKEIKKRICYKSAFYQSNLFYTVLHVSIFPIALFIDLFRNAFELDKSVINNKDFLQYVQTVENASVSNLPSEWSFSKQNRIIITFNQPTENSIRLRHLSYSGILAEISFFNEYITVLASGPALDVSWSNGTTNYLTSGKQISSPKHIDNCRLGINNEIEIMIENIDYDLLYCNIKCYSI